MPSDFSEYSDDQLMGIAGEKPATATKDLSGYSDEQLMDIAGKEPVTATKDLSGYSDEELIGIAESEPSLSFDPEGLGYDDITAADAGMTRNETGHMGSLDPRTGMVLKGRQHETWSKMLEAEQGLGNMIEQREDGRYYSIPKPKVAFDPESPYGKTEVALQEQVRRAGVFKDVYRGMFGGDEKDQVLPEGLGYLQAPAEDFWDWLTEDIMTPEEEERMAIKHPNWMALRHAGIKVLYPGIAEKLFDPEERERFNTLSPDKQRREILGVTVGYAAFIGAFKGAKPGAEALAKEFPRAFGWAVKDIRTFFKGKAGNRAWWKDLSNQERGKAYEGMKAMREEGFTDKEILDALNKRNVSEFDSVLNRKAAKVEAEGRIEGPIEPVEPGEPVEPEPIFPGLDRTAAEQYGVRPELEISETRKTVIKEAIGEMAVEGRIEEIAEVARTEIRAKAEAKKPIVEPIVPEPVEPVPEKPVEAPKEAVGEEIVPEVKPEVVVPEFEHTEDALEFGKKATSEQVTELKRLREESLEKSEEIGKIPKEQRKPDVAMEEALRGQYFREAIESADEVIGKKPKVVDVGVEKPAQIREKRAKVEIKAEEPLKTYSFEPSKAQTIGNTYKTFDLTENNLKEYSPATIKHLGSYEKYIEWFKANPKEVGKGKPVLTLISHDAGKTWEMFQIRGEQFTNEYFQSRIKAGWAKEPKPSVSAKVEKPTIAEKPVIGPQRFKGTNLDALVARSTKEIGKWQVTVFNKKGMPLSDTQFISHEKAIADAKKEVGITTPEESAAFQELLDMETAEIVGKIKGAYKEAKPHLLELGKHSYTEGMKSGDWINKMKTHLGDKWSRFKNKMREIWKETKAWFKRKLAEERGAITLKGRIRKVTGQVPEEKITIRERDALKIKIKAAAKAAREAERAGKKALGIKHRQKYFELKTKYQELYEKKAAKIKTVKDILQRRRGFIKAVQKQFGLSDRDLRKITKRDIRLMNNVEFKRFLNDIKIKAEKFEVKQQAANELELLRKDKELVREDNIRKFYKLPTIKNMTTKQLNEYAEILSKYEKGDQFLTPKRIKAIEDTPWEGSKTIRDVLEKASKRFDVPMKELEGIRVKELDRFRYDTALARQDPFYNYMVDTIRIEEFKAMTNYFEERGELYRLGKLAEKSRKRGVLGRLVPRQKELMQYLEAEGEAKIEAAQKLTKEELALGQYIWDFYSKAYDSLLISQELKSSRFADSKYVFHSKRPLSELLIDIKDTGIKSAAKDLLNRWRLDEAHFKILDSKTGKILGLKKFFRQTLYRTGELTPTQNVIKATDIYMQQFFRKMALDNSVPAIETLAIALRPKEKTQTGIFLNDRLMSLVREYLNNKKGRTINIGIQQGGRIDTAIRFVNQAISLRYIALNIPLQVAAIVGETTGKYVGLGKRKLLLANMRKVTPRGRRILKKYKAYVGEGVLEELFQPARNVGENINLLLYGLFKWNRKVTRQDILLGNMTKAEYKAETISFEKLAEVTRITGRWIDIEGAKSIMGSTSTGAAITKFRGWAIPIASSAAHDAASLARTLTRLGNPKKRLNKQQAQELYRIAEIGAIVGTVLSLSVDEDKDTFMGKLKYYALRELGTIFNALSTRTMLTLGVTVAFLEKLSQNLYLLLTLEKYKTKDELKGVRALKKQLTPTAVSQLIGGKKTERVERERRKIPERRRKPRKAKPRRKPRKPRKPSG